MYLIPIHVPIYVGGERTFVATDWKRALILLRDSLGGRFGQIALAAPSLPAELGADQRLEEISEATDGIRPYPSFDRRCRAREFWLRQRGIWLGFLRPLIAQASVVHAGLSDIYRPISFTGFCAGVRQGCMTVFVQDTDIVLQQRQLRQGRGVWERARSVVYSSLFDRGNRYGMRHATLVLLKGRSLMRRYGALSSNAHVFQNTAYHGADIVSSGVVAARSAELVNGGRPVRFVYCGRLIPRKGVEASLKVVRQARVQGANVEFDLIGDGALKGELQRRIREDAVLGKAVRLLPAMPYGRELIAKLAGYDALLFTPTAEDTPRMIFDGYAAGLPLVGYAIDYCQERLEEDRAAVLFPVGDVAAGAESLVQLDRQRGRLAELAPVALKAAADNASEVWYRRRADWTFEAYERRQHAAAHGEAVGVAAGVAEGPASEEPRVMVPAEGEGAPLGVVNNGGGRGC